MNHSITENAHMMYNNQYWNISINILWILCLSIFLECELNAQDLHVYYNIETEQIKYVFKGDTIQKPRAKEHGNIIVHVTELNNYIYDIEVEVSGEDITYPPIRSSPFNSIFKDGVTDILKNKSTKDILLPQPRTETSVALQNVERIEIDVPSGFGGESEEAKLEKLRVSFAAELRQLSAIEKNIISQQQLIDNILRRDKVRQIAKVNISAIQKNPKIKPSRIKELVKQYVLKIFNEKMENLDLDDLLRVSEPKKELNREISNLHREVLSYKEVLVQLEGTQHSMVNIDLQEEQEFDQLSNIITQVYERANQYTKNLADDEVRMYDVVNELGDADFQSLSELRLMAEEIAQNDFTETFRVTALKDRTHLKINVKKKAESGSESEIPDKTATSPIIIPTVGGLKMSASVGLSFGQFFERPQSYNIINGVIEATDEDSFYPNITSYFHFFPQSAGNLTLGGTFGIGLPLTDQGRGQSASFSLGASMIVGKIDQVILSAGVMGGRNEQLGNGFKVGDQFDNFSGVLPLKYPYQLGYFVGLSFSFL